MKTLEQLVQEYPPERLDIEKEDEKILSKIFKKHLKERKSIPLKGMLFFYL